MIELETGQFIAKAVKKVQPIILFLQAQTFREWNLKTSASFKFQKNGRMIRLTIAAALLFLITPQVVLAQGNRTDEGVAQEILDKAPKTPKELLRRLKILFENPNISAFEFGEHVTGIGMNHWKAGTALYEGKPTWYRYDIKEPRFHIEVDSLNHSSYVLWQSRISFEVVPDNKVIQCITPQITKEVLGEPTKALFKKSSIDAEYYRVYYRYELKNNLVIRFFYNEGDYTSRPYTEISKRKDLISKYENHKDFCGHIFILTEEPNQKREDTTMTLTGLRTNWQQGSYENDRNSTGATG